MSNQFILPNWHVVLIHFPLGLLITGLIIEWLSFLWRSNPIRIAARWMMLLGALSAIPVVAAGIYAFRDVVAASEPTDGMWYEVVAQSHWNANQWELMEDHVTLSSTATGIAVVVAVAWVASYEALRRSRLWYALMLLAMTAAAGLMGAGAWNSGESVYRQGTAVAALNPPETAPGNEQDQGARATVEYYIPPLQLHVVLAGIAFAFAAGAFGWSIKRWDPAYDSAGVATTPATPATATQERVEPRPITNVDIAQSFTAMTPPPPARAPAAARPRPGWFWIFTCIFALLSALAGIWSVGGLTPSQIVDAINECFEKGHARLLWHLGFGLTILVLPLILAAIVRWTRRARAATLTIAILLILAIGFQLWLGIAMIYDSHMGPLAGFNPPGTHHVHPH